MSHAIDRYQRLIADPGALAIPSGTWRGMARELTWHYEQHADARPTMARAYMLAAADCEDRARAAEVSP